MLYRFDGHFQSERIGTGTAMAFENLGHVADGFGDAGEDVAYNADADKSGDGEADLGRIHLGAEADDDAGVFHLADAFGHGGECKADPTSEFGE